MEEFDIIDKDDNIVGSTDKLTAHSQKQLHRVAAVYVFDKQGRLYVQVHKASGGYLDHSVGGHVRKGENYHTAAAREALEELGIEQDLNYLSTFYSDEKTNLHMYGLFECTAHDNWKFTPNEEVKEVFPLELTKIWKMMDETPEKFTLGFLKTMDEYRKIKSKH